MDISSIGGLGAEPYVELYVGLEELLLLNQEQITELEQLLIKAKEQIAERRREYLSGLMLPLLRQVYLQEQITNLKADKPEQLWEDWQQANLGHVTYYMDYKRMAS